MTPEEKALIGKELHQIVDEFAPKFLELAAEHLTIIPQTFRAMLVKAVEAQVIPEADHAIDKLVGV